MEEDEQVRNTLIKIAERVESESETEEDIEPKTKIESVKENVINVNFN